MIVAGRLHGLSTTLCSEAPLSLETQFCKYRVGHTKVQIASTAASFSIRTCVFTMPRPPNQRCYFSLSALYHFMQLRSFKGQPSNWIYRGRASWDKAFVEQFGSKLIVDGTMFNPGCAVQKEALAFSERCLPEPCIATAGLLSLLQRFAYAHRNKGGLAEADARGAAAHLFVSFLRSGLAKVDPSRPMTATIAEKWTPTWPRPQPIVDKHSVVCLLLEGDELDLSGIEEAANGDNSIKLAGVMSRTIRRMYGAVKIPFLAFMRDAAMVPCLRSLNAQILWHMSLYIEATLGALAQAKQQPQRIASSLSFVWDADAHIGSCKVDQAISMYVRSSYERLSQETFFGVATDKAWVHALPIQQSIISLASGVAVYAVPAVPAARNPRSSSEVRSPPQSIVSQTRWLWEQLGAAWWWWGNLLSVVREISPPPLCGPRAT